MESSGSYSTKTPLSVIPQRLSAAKDRQAASFTAGHFPSRLLEDDSVHFSLYARVSLPDVGDCWCLGPLISLFSVKLL